MKAGFCSQEGCLSCAFSDVESFRFSLAANRQIPPRILLRRPGTVHCNSPIWAPSHLGFSPAIHCFKILQNTRIAWTHANCSESSIESFCISSHWVKAEPRWLNEATSWIYKWGEIVPQTRRWAPALWEASGAALEELRNLRCPSAAAQLLRHHQRVVAVDLQQVEQKEPVSVGVQAHRPHALLGERRVGARRHLAEGLENPVVLLQEEAEDSFKLKTRQSKSRFPATLAHFLSLSLLDRSGCQIRQWFIPILIRLCCHNVKPLLC